jgi:hypothetical protein
MNRQVRIAVLGDKSIVDVRILQADFGHIGGIYPKGERGAEVIIKGRLGGFLLPGPRQSGIKNLYW